MIDDIRIALQVKHTPFKDGAIGQDGLLRSYRPNKRYKIYGVGGRTLRIRSVRNGTLLVIEGSFNGFLHGHNIVGLQDLDSLVQQVIPVVLKCLGVIPTRDEKRKIAEGRIKLERLDIVGFLRVDHLGGPSAVLDAMDFGLAGSRTARTVFPGETIIYHSDSQYWSLSAYDKALQTDHVYPATWKVLPSALKSLAEMYLRFELRQLRKELREQEIFEVKDVDMDEQFQRFQKKLTRLLDDLRSPPPSGVAVMSNPSPYLMCAMLCAEGIDLLANQPIRFQRRARRAFVDAFGVSLRPGKGIPKQQSSILRKLTKRPCFPIRHGKPNWVQLRTDAGLDRRRANGLS